MEGFEAYEVSDLGRVKRIIVDKRNHRPKVLKPCVDKAGYLHVTLVKDNKKHHGIVHRMVAKAFLPNPNGLPEVNHKGPKSDCRATMLEWRSKRGHIFDQALRGQKGDGVHFNKEREKWRATYSPSVGKEVYIGSFSTKREALAARQAAVEALPEVL